MAANKKISRSKETGTEPVVVRPLRGAAVPGAESVAYRGAVPMKGFLGWVVLVILAAGVVGFTAAQLLVGQRMGQLVDDTVTRVELQGQGRAAVVGEWADGLARMGDSVAASEVVELFVAEEGKSADSELARAMQAQRPYMEQLLKEFVARNRLSGAHVVRVDGRLVVSEGQGVEEVAKGTEALRAVAQGGVGVFRPLRMGKQGVTLDVLRPIKAPGMDNDGPVTGVLWMTLPVGDKLAELVAATRLDRRGERTAMIQNDNGKAVVVGRTALAPLSEDYMDLENRLSAGRVVQESVVDAVPVFSTIRPVEGTPFALLQEYTAREALGVMGVFKPGLYAIVALLVVVLAALMLALTIHLMGQRNKTRVKLLGQTMDALVRVVEARDPFLAGHHSRVARLAVQVGNHMHLGVGERATLYYAAQLGSVGRLLVPSRVLAKKGKLSPAERKELETHVRQAVGVLGDIDFDLPITQVIGEMYEREDGSGHPKGLKGGEISRMGKVLAACDAFVALTSARSHRSAMSKEAALKVMGGGAFAREVVSAIRSAA